MQADARRTSLNQVLRTRSNLRGICAKSEPGWTEGEHDMHSTSLHQTVLTQHQARAVETIDRYWHMLAAGALVPRRSQIDPSAIQDALDYAFIAERVSGGHARFRVAGGSISAVLGMEVAGMPLAAVISPVMRDRFASDLALLFTTPSKLSIGLCAPASDGQPGLEAQLRLYPLRGGAGGVTQILGSFVVTGAIGRRPRRFMIGKTESRAVSQHCSLHLPPIRARGHLSLVVSNA